MANEYPTTCEICGKTEPVADCEICGPASPLFTKAIDVTESVADLLRKFHPEASQVAVYGTTGRLLYLIGSFVTTSFASGARAAPDEDDEGGD